MLAWSGGIREKGGFEELYDYENDPELLDGEINTPGEHAHVDDLRHRLETMRVSAGDAYRAAENQRASQRDAGADRGPSAGGALDPERPAKAQRPLAHRAQPKVPRELAAWVEAYAIV